MHAHPFGDPNAIPPRLWLSISSLLLALFIPSIFIAEAARSNPTPTPDGVPTVAEADARAGAAAPETEGAAAARIKQNYGLLPLSFEANRGQADARVQFLARNNAYSLYLAAGEIGLALRGTVARARGARGA